MKLYIITISDVYDYEAFQTEPVVCLSRKEARKELARLKKSGQECYHFDSADPYHPDRFSLYPDGEWGKSHYDAKINEVEVPIPVVSLSSTSLNGDTLLSLETKIFTDHFSAEKEMRKQVKAEFNDAKISGYEEIEKDTSENFAKVEYPSGDGMQEYQWKIEHFTI